MCPTAQLVRDTTVVLKLQGAESVVCYLVFQGAVADGGWWEQAGRGQQAGRGLGKLLILTWSYSVKNLSKQWESTAKLCLLFFGSPSRPAWHFWAPHLREWQMCVKVSHIFLNVAAIANSFIHSLMICLHNTGVIPLTWWIIFGRVCSVCPRTLHFP